MSVNILYLYSETMDLYGDSFNIIMIKSKLLEMGIEANISKYEIGEELEADKYDMFYIGHGKGRNLEFIAKDFLRHKEKVIKAIEDEKVFLVTGNARLLFGKDFEGVSGKMVQANGFFDYTGSETNNVFTSDTVAKLHGTENLCYGYINRTAHIVGENKYPLFDVVLGVGDTKEKGGFEGNHYKNYFATWFVGPALIKNPQLLKIILKPLAKELYKDLNMTEEQKALDATLSEFKDLK